MSLAELLQNPKAAQRELMKARCEDSLLDYVGEFWPILEPGRKFKRGWAVEAIAEHLEAVSDNKILRLLINVPPGMSKSLLTNVFWPTWEWGPRKQPWLRYLSVSYSQGLTRRDNRKSRTLVKDPKYVDLFGEILTISSDESNVDKFSNDQSGWRLATSTGGRVMGERGDRVIVDDPNDTAKVESRAELQSVLQWFTEVLPTRINDPSTSAIVIIMQRVHESDVSGHILASEMDYVHLCLPMEFESDRRCYTPTRLSYMNRQAMSRGVELREVEHSRLPRLLTIEKTDAEAGKFLSDEQRVSYEEALRGGTLKWKKGYSADLRQEDNELLFPERFPRDYLEKDLKPSLRSWGGTYAEAGQLQQRPSPRGGAMFHKGWFQFIDFAPACSRIVRGWDLAGSKDKRSAMTVGLKLGEMVGGGYVVIDVTRGKWSPHEVNQEILRCAQQDGPLAEFDFPQDPGQAGKTQVMSLRSLLASTGVDVYSSPETGDKADRARPFAAQAEGGNVYLVRAPWNDAFLAEIGSFPASETKDQVDAASRAFARLTQMPEAPLGLPPKTVGVN